jgi:hypothetical protein
MDISISYDLVAGTVVAFCCAVIAVGLDLQDGIRAQLGRLANTSVLNVWPGRFILLGWGLFDAVMYLIIINHKEWAKNTFHFDVDQNKIVAGLAIGISAVLIIRSKLAKVGNVEIGGELAYLWSRAYVLDAVNAVRVQKRIKYLNRYGAVTKAIQQYPSFFTDLEGWLTQRLLGLPDIKPRVEAQIGEIKKQAQPSPDQDASARLYLVGVVLDFFGHTELDSFARTVGISVPQP